MIKIFIIIVAVFIAGQVYADSWDQLQNDLGRMGLDAGPRPTEDPQVVTVETEPSNPSMPEITQSSLTYD